MDFTWIFIVLAHWNNSPLVDMSLHSNTLFWFRAKQSLFLLLNAACSAEKVKIPLYSLWFDRTDDLPHSRRTRWQLHQRCGSAYINNAPKGWYSLTILPLLLFLLLPFYEGVLHKDIYDRTSPSIKSPDLTILMTGCRLIIQLSNEMRSWLTPHMFNQKTYVSSIKF